MPEPRTPQDKATKARFAVTEIIGDMNGKGNHANAARLEAALNSCPQESLARLYDIIHDANYNPLGTW